MAARPQRVCVAQIGAPHGVRGELKLRSFTVDPLAIAGYGSLETEDGATRFTIEAIRAAGDHLIVRLSGIADREAAARLTNARLFVPRERLPAPAADEFYHADLLGLAAETVAGDALGTVIAVHNFGAGDLIEIRPARGGATVLVPFTQSAVPVVDIARGRIVVDPPAGTMPGESGSM